ncbi:hypothetical protein ASE07_00505 [Noviherbaspirillum sp. Root189]|nr:hypothetical protein ASE07_00505 [Noviherbaspirillum sp. Root189]
MIVAHENSLDVAPNRSAYVTKFVAKFVMRLSADLDWPIAFFYFLFMMLSEKTTFLHNASGT